jgi:hypothetical protein
MIDAMNRNSMRKSTSTLLTRFRKTVRRIEAARQDLIMLQRDLDIVGSLEEFKVRVFTWIEEWKTSLDTPVEPRDPAGYYALLIDKVISTRYSYSIYG